ncbi:hypothetical protein ACIRLA_28935 [Streptomyces sp. NPDC102364]|uniref:hypothetical protein n=1 Tax=Streptomyces sp. NPDC102364 TaxID=3366161 RepID=UPI0038177A8A
MADAKSTTVEKQVTETKKVPAITLTLSKDEAEALMVLVGNVSGEGSSPRKHTDAIYYALKSARVDVLAKDISLQLDGRLRWLKTPRSRFSY